MQEMPNKAYSVDWGIPVYDRNPNDQWKCGDRMGWINHESYNTMGYNTTFLLCFITVILTLAEKIFLTPPLSPNMYTCTYMNRAPPSLGL